MCNHSLHLYFLTIIKLTHILRTYAQRVHRLWQGKNLQLKVQILCVSGNEYILIVHNGKTVVLLLALLMHTSLVLAYITTTAWLTSNQSPAFPGKAIHGINTLLQL